MITVRGKKVTNGVLFFPRLFVDQSVDKKNISVLTTTLSVLLNKKYSTLHRKRGSVIFIINRDGTECSFEKNTKVTAYSGDVFVMEDDARSRKYSIENFLCLYEVNYLPEIFLRISTRFSYFQQFEKYLDRIKKLGDWNQTVQDELHLDFVGKGTYANVFRSNISYFPIAIKMAKVKPEAVEYIYNTTFSSWHETYFNDRILYAILRNKMSPNLPFMYQSFTSKDCELVFNQKTTKTPCVITLCELASGNLKEYLAEKRSTNELRSALFQIMSALHAIQKYQINNYDIKKENILYCNTIPGGYWKYKIGETEYFVPNYGHLFILNDFGVSKILSPEHRIYKTPEDKTYRLGSRYGIVKDGKIIPLNAPFQFDENGKQISPVKLKWDDGTVSFGAEFRIDRDTDKIIKIPIEFSDEIKNYLESKKIGIDTGSIDFFLSPEIIPPFEFYNDLQDTLRMFAGGKRTTQKGDHGYIDTVGEPFAKQLDKYIGADSLKNKKLPVNPAFVLADYFIHDFFGKTEYVKPVDKKEIIESYDML